MTVTDPHRRGPTDEKLGAIAVWTVAGLAILVGLVTNVAERVAGPPDLPRDPFTVTFGVFHVPDMPPLPWTTGCTLVAVGCGLLLLAPGVGWLAWHRRHRRRRRKIDAAAAYLATRDDLRPVTRRAVTELAAELGASTTRAGITVGRAVPSGEPVLQDDESTSADVWGTRRGKSTARIIPAILEARPESPVITTSRRRDVHDATRGTREATGPVWLFDPEHIIGLDPAMWWNPVSYVLAGPEGPPIKAQMLADIFAASAIPADSKQDAYFDPEGTELLGHFLLAAAVSGRDLRHVYRWVINASPTNVEPGDLLEHRYPMAAAAVREMTRAPEKQRAGVFGSAKRRLWWMVAEEAHTWITPQPGRPQFDPDAFIRSNGTLYLMSRGGRGSLAAVTTALAAAVCGAAEQAATRSPGGRLRNPLLAALDEIANTCRWPDLPDKFSYYGGSGIILMVMLQSWAQGEELWGRGGMAKLWSAANLRVYGGGSAETGFLRDLTELAGSYRPVLTSDSTGRGGRTVSHSEGKERVLSVSDLTGMPKGRALVFAGLPRPVLIAPQPWKAGPHAEAVRASIRRYDPAAEETLAAVDAEPVLDPTPDVPPAGAAWKATP